MWFRCRREIRRSSCEFSSDLLALPRIHLVRDDLLFDLFSASDSRIYASLRSLHVLRELESLLRVAHLRIKRVLLVLLLGCFAVGVSLIGLEERSRCLIHWIVIASKTSVKG